MLTYHLTKTMTRRAFVSSFARLAFACSFPSNAHAQDHEVDCPSGSALEVVESPNGYLIHDYDSCETVEVLMSDNCFQIRANGELLHDGIIHVVPKDVSMYPSQVQADDINSVPSGYTLMTTVRYGSSYSNASLVAAIIAAIGFYPTLFNLSSAVLAWLNSANPVYLSISYYYNSSNKMWYAVIKLYKYSNYTGLLQTYEYGPYYGSSPLVHDDDETA